MCESGLRAMTHAFDFGIDSGQCAMTHVLDLGIGSGLFTMTYALHVFKEIGKATLERSWGQLKWPYWIPLIPPIQEIHTARHTFQRRACVRAHEIALSQIFSAS